MGFEEYRVRLVGGAASLNSKRLAVEQYAPHPHLGNRSGTIYEGHFEDGRHVIEVVLRPKGDITVRFAICHPTTVDERFIELVKSLGASLGMDVETPVPTKEGLVKSTSPDYVGFADAARTGILAQRSEWRKMSTEEAGITIEEEFRRFVAPMYLPKV